MGTKNVLITCEKCGAWFECEGYSIAQTRSLCYSCKPSRITKNTTKRGCPRCGRIFVIDEKRPDLKQCPSCRSELAEMKQRNRIKRGL